MALAGLWTTDGLTISTGMAGGLNDLAVQRA